MPFPSPAMKRTNNEQGTHSNTHIKQSNGSYRVYIKADVQMLPDGTIVPKAIYWGGQRYELDRPPKQPDKNKTGGMALRFICQINGKDRFLYLLHDTVDKFVLRWYVESPVPEPLDYAE